MEKIKDSYFKNIIGGYHNLDKNTKALVGITENDMTYFFPINDQKKIVIFPAMEISDKTLNGFMNAIIDDFEGYGDFKVKKMKIDEVERYKNYTLSFDPSDMPDNW